MPNDWAKSAKPQQLNSLKEVEDELYLNSKD
jgi:hypothetical protein